MRSLTGALALSLLASACSVGDRYLIAPETLASIHALPIEARSHTAAPAHRLSNGQGAYVRSAAFALGEVSQRSDGQLVLLTRTHSRQVQLGHVLVWLGTPLSLAGLAMVIWGRDAVRWSGIALSAAAEPVMIAGTVVWVRGAKARPEEVARGVPELSYLPEPGSPSQTASPRAP